MYVENVRYRLTLLNDQEKSKLAEKTKEILKNQGKIGKSVKVSHILGALNKFTKGKKEISLTYFQGFLEALDQEYPNGGQDALLNQKIKVQKTWRNTFLKITNDTIGINMEPYVDDEYILTEMKALFLSTVEICIRDSKEETQQTLSVLNGILNNVRNKES